MALSAVFQEGLKHLHYAIGDRACHQNENRGEDEIGNDHTSSWSGCVCPDYPRRMIAEQRPKGRESVVPGDS
jgi:hypothetical protein